MKKFILPVINLISLILSGIVFGLGANTAVEFKYGNVAAGNWYQLVWQIAPQSNPNAFGIVGFFVFIAAVFFTLVTMIPFKARKFCVALVGLLFVAAGVFFFLTPNGAFGSRVNLYQNTDSFIAMAVLVFVAGGLELLGAAVEFLPEKK